jgi:hypothetical protein
MSEEVKNMISIQNGELENRNFLSRVAVSIIPNHQINFYPFIFYSESMQSVMGLHRHRRRRNVLL